MRALAVLLALLAPTVAAAAPDEPTTAEVTIAFGSLEGANMSATQRWEGQAGADFRASLDASFGNGDGVLVASEADSASRALARSLLGERMHGLVLDQAPALVTGAESDITLVGELVVEARIVMALAFVASDGGHTLGVAPAWETRFRVVPPDGWALAGDSQATIARGTSGEWVLIPAAFEVVEQESRPAAYRTSAIVLLSGSGVVLAAVAALRFGKPRKQSS